MASMSPKRICRGHRPDIEVLHGGERKAELRTCGKFVGRFRSGGGYQGRQFAERPPTGAAEVASRLDGPALSLIEAAAVLAAPGIFGQRSYFFAQRVIDRDAQAVAIHPDHHATKIGPMIRATLQDIVLPLVNHFVRQGHDGFVARLRAVGLKQHRRQSDATSSGWCLGGARERLSWPDAADKHAGRGGQSAAPFNGNRG
jgi:hypothetical protein